MLLSNQRDGGVLKLDMEMPEGSHESFLGVQDFISKATILSSRYMVPFILPSDLFSKLRKKLNDQAFGDYLGFWH